MLIFFYLSSSAFLLLLMSFVLPNTNRGQLPYSSLAWPCFGWLRARKDENYFRCREQAAYSSQPLLLLRSLLRAAAGP